MKNKFVGFLIFAFLLSSCGEVKSKNNDDYITSIDIFKYKDEVKILQLSDIHWSFSSDIEREKKYLTSLVKKTDPDIIVTTGDNILACNKETLDNLMETLDSFINSSNKHVYWAITWGNHDRQGVFSPNYPDSLASSFNTEKIYQYINNSQHNDNLHYGLYRSNIDDDVYGRSNYVVNLTDGDKTYWNLYMLDSNCDYYTGSHYEYDAINENQIEWFNNIAKSNEAPGLAFFHIPLFQIAYAYDNVIDGIIKEGNYGGEFRESIDTKQNLANYVKHEESTAIYPGYRDTGFYKAAKENNVKGIFFGHDHINDFWALYDENATLDNNPNGTKDDILLAYATKTGDSLYYKSGLLGGNLITINKNGIFDGHESSKGNTSFRHVYLNYEDINNE